MAEEAEDNLPPEGEGAEELASQQTDAPEVEHQQADQGEANAPSDVEALAQEMGWAPKEQWRGDPDAWKDAKTFLKTTVEINRTLSKDVRGLKDTVDRLSRTSATIAERAIAEERARLAQRFTDATQAGDTEGAWEAAQELQRVSTPEPVADPLADFRARNAWYDTDPEARAYAFSIGELNKGKPADEVFRLAEEAVRKRFPEHFKDARQESRPQQRAPLVSNPQTRAARPQPKERGVADLPPEARKAGEDFVRRGRIGSLADYAKVYWQENA